MLLMLVLPLQTVAAAGMLGCASAHPAALDPMPTVDEMTAACHEQQPQDAPVTQHNCTYCAVCALASVLPVPAIALPAPIPDTERFASHHAASFSGFIPDGPERPPRSSFA